MNMNFSRIRLNDHDRIVKKKVENLCGCMLGLQGKDKRKFTMP